MRLLVGKKKDISILNWIFRVNGIELYDISLSIFNIPGDIMHALVKCYRKLRAFIL